MRFYYPGQSSLILYINRVFFEADRSRVSLALQRLGELDQLFSNNARVRYNEGLIRGDYLGQGLKARELYEEAYRLAPDLPDPGQIRWLAACNAAYLARDENEFRRWTQIALQEGSSQQPEDREAFQRDLGYLDTGAPYSDVLQLRARQHFQLEQYGECAAVLNIALQAGEIPLEQEIDMRRMRALSLRSLDAASETRRTAGGEEFPPDERLALQEAVSEMNRVIALDQYEPAFWNYRSAWHVLLKRNDEAIEDADRALDLRSYPRPWLNKARAYWNLGQRERAVQCARTAVETARSYEEDPEELTKATAALDHYLTAPLEPTLQDLYPALTRLTSQALATSREEFGTVRGITFSQVLRRLATLLPTVAANPLAGYVPLVAELLTDFTAETAFSASGELSEQHGEVVEYCIASALFVVCHGDGLIRRDAARYLCLMCFFLLTGPILQGMTTQLSPEQLAQVAQRGEERVRQYYRDTFLAVSAAATGPLSHLDEIMREELGRIHPDLPRLIAEQQPVSEAERQGVRRRILRFFEHFTPEPVYAEPPEGVRRADLRSDHNRADHSSAPLQVEARSSVSPTHSGYHTVIQQYPLLWRGASSLGCIALLLLLPALFMGPHGIGEKVAVAIAGLVLIRVVLDANAWAQVAAIRGRRLCIRGEGAMASPASECGQFLTQVGALVTEHPGDAEFQITLLSRGGGEWVRFEDRAGNHTEGRLCDHTWLQSVGFHLGRFIRASDTTR